jgi:hypothetical protein
MDIVDHYLRKLLGKSDPYLIHTEGKGGRSTSYRIYSKNIFYYQKVFVDTQEGKTSFENESLAAEIFAGYPWKIPWISKTQNSFITLYYPQRYRLNICGHNQSKKTKKRIAVEVINILFDIFQKGYAHRDAHAKNIFLIKNRLYLFDFEVIAPYPNSFLPPFPLSYDITGLGLDSPYLTNRMCYQSRSKFSLQNILKIPVEEVLSLFVDELKNKLKEASTSFKTVKGRHQCLSQKIYNSFDLPYLKIKPEEAQRDSNIRLKKLGIGPDQIQGKSLLDLGCHAGGMIFAIQFLKPGQCTGVEYDQEKVNLARKIAAYNGLNNVNFLQGNIEEFILEREYDNVFCFAIEAHIQNKSWMYSLLGKVTAETLYFEGNSTTNIQEVIDNLKINGFTQVDYLGICEDDYIQENNIRPIFIARK